jgi:hypothetical protein
MNLVAARIGAIFYVIWGIIHMIAGYQILELGQALDPGVVQGRIFQDAWNIFLAGVVVIVIAVALNWRNSRTGFWINLILVSLLDIGYVVLVLAPGYDPLWLGLQGPVAWVIAATFSTVGFAARPHGSVAPNADHLRERHSH